MTYRRSRIEEGQCPDCGEWSLVAWDGSLPPGGFWWAESAGCPECGAVVLVESECEFRPASFAGHLEALSLAFSKLRAALLDEIARVWRGLVGP